MYKLATVMDILHEDMTCVYNFLLAVSGTQTYRACLQRQVFS